MAGLGIRETLVGMALDRSATAHLFAEHHTMPASKARLSRRDLMRAAGISLLVPVVDSMVAPLAAEAASTVPDAQCEGACIGIGLNCVQGGKCVEIGPGKCDCV
jgi:hypothetical protein